MTIILDPGHGPKGNPYPHAPGCFEGTQMWRLAGYLAAELGRYGFAVATTRPSLSDDPSLTARGRAAKGADMFLSLHSNASPSTATRGSECFCSVRGMQHKPLAAKLSADVSALFGHADRGAKTNPSTKHPGQDYFTVQQSAAAVGCTCALLIEHGFHTNSADTALLTNDSFLQRLAKAEAEIIAEYFGAKEEDTVAGQSITIKPGDIAVVGLYRNTGKRTLAQIKAETGAGVLINAGYFNSDFTPCLSGLTIDGNKYVPGYDPGYAFSGSKVVRSSFNAERLPDYIGGAPALLVEGQRYKTNITPEPQWSAKRGRSAIGRKADGSLYLYCCNDASGITMDTLRGVMQNNGCVDAIALDGGGSAQCDLGGKAVKSDREVYSLILIWRKTDLLKHGRKGKAVRHLQKALMEHGHKLPRYGVDGDFGDETEGAVKLFQAKNKLVVDGIVGKNTWTKLEG